MVLKKNSDLVGNYTVYLANDNQLYYDFRISEDLDLNRNRVKTKFAIGENNVNVNYIQIKKLC